MPIYEYRCECGNEEEILFLARQISDWHTCPECNKAMTRKVSLPVSIIPETGRDHVLQTLNAHNGHGLPCAPRDRPRMETALAKGLDQTRPTIGVGMRN